jgi:single-strand DNA-binding protein
MKLIGLVRLGRDAETRYTSTGDAVCGFSAAFNYGRKGDDGKQPSQWVEFSLWGQRAERLSEYLLKGTQLFVVASDVHVETYEKRDGGSGVKLVARVDDLQFAGSKADGGGEQRQAAPAPAPRAPAPAPRQAAPKTGTGFDDMDSDIPF